LAVNRGCKSFVIRKELVAQLEELTPLLKGLIYYTAEVNNQDKWSPKVKKTK
jgi:hypothetical protein